MSDSKEKHFLIKHAKPISFCLVALAGYIGYLWWSTTPYHALRQVRRSIKMHDQETFNKYVDVAGIVSKFTDEIIYLPAAKTEKLTKFQQVVGLGALGMSKIPIDNTLIFQIQKWIQRKPDMTGNEEKEDKIRIENCTIEPKSENLKAAESADQIDKERDLPNLEESPSLGDILKTELKHEVKMLKEKSYNRMVDYARHHPDTLVNRIFVVPEGKKRNSFRKLLRHYGFTAQNIKKVQIKKLKEKYICTLFFFCPITESAVPVHLELSQEKGEDLPHYRIKRIIKVKETFKLLGEDTDKQVQGLVTHGLKNLSFKSAMDETKDFFKRVKEKAEKTP